MTQDSKRTAEAFEDIIKTLDGIACVNLLEPSPGDLERVVKAYGDCRKQLAENSETIFAQNAAIHHLRYIIKDLLNDGLVSTKKSIDLEHALSATSGWENEC